MKKTARGVKPFPHGNDRERRRMRPAPFLLRLAAGLHRESVVHEGRHGFGEIVDGRPHRLRHAALRRVDETERAAWNVPVGQDAHKPSVCTLTNSGS